MPRILIVEDDAELSALLAENLTAERHRTRVAATGREAVALVEEWRPDLVVLDLMLPDTGGRAVLRSIRGTGYVGPVLILSAKGDQRTKVAGFRDGADDYVTKPFGLLELLARIETLLRRVPEARLPETVTLGNVEIRPAARTVLRGSEGIKVRPKEMDLLLALLARANRAVSRRTLLTEVWGYSPRANTRTVDWHVAELRRRIEAEPGKPRYLRTVRGVGYRLDVPDSTDDRVG